MVNQELLKQQFLCFGVDNLSDNVVSKCIELCEIYGVDEEEFVETWMAFSVSNLGGEDPSVDSLGLLERKELSKRQDAPIVTHNQPQGSLVIYNGNESAVESDLNDDILSVYSCTPKAKAKVPFHRQDDRTPENRRTGRSPRAIFSPASFSPTVATPSTKYKSRINKGNVVCSFGDTQQPTTRHSSFLPHINVLSKLKDDVCYMYNPLRERMYILDDILEWQTEELVKAFSLPEPQDFTQAHQEQFIAVGKVCCDCNGRLNAKSVLLEGSRAMCQGRTIPVDVTQVDNFSLFPGQIVAMEAENPTGKKLMAKKIFMDIQPPKPSALPTLSSEGPLQVVIAAGPFTQSDTLTYEPLEDLVEYLQEHLPHVVILTGPFTDACHPFIIQGNLAETYQALFEKIVDGIMTPLKGLNIQVLLVPSWRDVHHHAVYPTPPFVLRKTYPNLMLLPDPCLVDIEGVVFGITSTDILFHLGKEEISKIPIASDRLGRLASHILMQRSFYPLYPPAEEMSVDLDLWAKHTSLNVTPHIIVLPSDLRYFVKNINGCVVVNPERLAKGMVGGNFARLVISPPFTDTDISKNISCQIVKI